MSSVWLLPKPNVGAINRGICIDHENVIIITGSNQRNFWRDTEQTQINRLKCSDATLMGLQQLSPDC